LLRVGPLCQYEFGAGQSATQSSPVRSLQALSLQYLTSWQHLRFRYLLSVVGPDRLAHQTVTSVRFQDLRKLTATLDSGTEAMKSLDSADAKTNPADRSTEEAKADERASAARQGAEL